jgi:hypothetical protein
MKTHGFVLGAALAATLAVASCNAPPQTTGASALNAVSVSSLRGSTVTTDGSTITASRSGEGNQGVILRRSAVLVHFTVEGEDPRIRISRGAQDMVTRPAEDNAVMIGPGGASSVTVFSATGAEVKVNVTSVVDCATAPEGACQAPQFPNREQDEGGEGGETTEGATPATP